MAQTVVYGDISPRTAAYVIKDLLTRAMPYMVIEKFGQNYPIPTNNTKTAKWRRYFLQGATGSAGSGSGNYFVPLAPGLVLNQVGHFRRCGRLDHDASPVCPQLQ